nr:ABC transporter substrate-binding protein [Salidesulfovibrio onnuriiensis]
MRRLMLFVLVLLVAACDASAPVDTDGGAVPGVSDTVVRVGSSLALTGHAGYLGTQTLRGAMSCIRSVNEAGGVHGRTIEVDAVDDSYDPPRCLANTQNFIIGNNVFALFSYVGTPTTVKIMPMLEEAGVPLLGVFTGANALREPFNKYIINIRASYYQETEAAVRHLVQDLGFSRIAVFYQFDAYGFDGLIGTELGLKRFGLEPVARGSYIRGTQDVEEGLARIKASKAQAVVMVGTYDACARFIRRATDEDFTPVYYNVSFVGAEELARRLRDLPRAPVVMSQVVPPPVAEITNESALDYVRLLGRYYPGEVPSFVGLEGYLNARILVEGLRRAGRDLTREGFIRAIESIADYPLGPDLHISFGPQDHQGLDRVYFTRLREGRIEPLKDWKTLAPSAGGQGGGS